MKLFYVTVTWRPYGCRKDRRTKAVVLAESCDDAIEKFKAHVSAPATTHYYDASAITTDVFTFS